MSSGLPKVSITTGPVVGGDLLRGTEVLGIDVDFVNPWAVPVTGRWRMNVVKAGRFTEEVTEEPPTWTSR